MRTGIFSFKLLAFLVLFLAVSAAYLYAFPQPNIFFAAIVLLHALGGVFATLLLIVLVWRRIGVSGWTEYLGWFLLLLGGALGCALIYTGTSRSQWNLLYVHILICAIATAFLLAARAGRRWMSGHAGAVLLRYAIVVVLIGIVSCGAWYVRNVRWPNSARIQNPPDAPASMDGEGDGPKGNFFPSSAQVVGGGKIPGSYFMESDSCKRCHQDIYTQWYSSAHHFSSFNNQWYRNSIDYMQDVV